MDRSRSRNESSRSSGRGDREPSKTPRDGGERGRERGASRGRGNGSEGFSYRRRTAEEVKKRADQRGGGDFDSILADHVKVYKVNDGDNLIRILPPTWPDAAHYGFDIFVHYGVGPDRQAYLCPKEMKGEDCPICEERARAQKEDDEVYAKELKASKRVLIYLVDREHEKDGVMAWSMPWTVDRDLSNLGVDKKSGEVLPIDDPENGYDVEFARKGKAKTTEYIGLAIARRESDLGNDDWMQYAVDNPLPDQLVYFDYDHIADVFGGKATKKREDEFDDNKQDRELRNAAERPTRGKNQGSDLTWEGLHSMTYEELVAVVAEKKLDIAPDDSENDAQLADWICEDLKLVKTTSRSSGRHGAREEADAEPSPREKLGKMRRTAG